MAESGASQRLVAGRYRLTGILGRGGMGVVWRATDEMIGRQVAVKEVRAGPGLSTQERALFAERALREARLTGRIDHPAVVTIYDVVPPTADDEAVYLVTQLVEAPTLAELIERAGPLPADRVLAIGAGLLRALDAAHATGVVHRDIKPSNIMVLGGDEVRLVDFGIAAAEGHARLTRDGVMGSSGYLAPELFRGLDPTPAADLWSTGVTLFHAVEGRGPFDRGSAAATVHAVLYDDPPDPGCGPPLAGVIAGLLTRDVERRMTLRQALGLLHPPAGSGRGAAAPPRPDPATTRPEPGLAATGREPDPATTPSERSSATIPQEPQPAGAARATHPPGAGLRPDPPGGDAGADGAAGWESRPTNVQPVAAAEEPATPGEQKPGTAPAPAAASPRREALLGWIVALCVAGACTLTWGFHWPAFYGVGASVIVCVVALNSPRRDLCAFALAAVLAGSFIYLYAHRDDPVRLATDYPDRASNALVFSPNGYTLAAARGDDSIALWDVAQRKLTGTLAGHTGSIRSLAFAPSGGTLASAGDDGTVKLWDVAGRRLVNTLTEGENHGGELFLAFSPGGTILADVGRTIELRPMADVARPVVIDPGVASIRVAGFSSDGRSFYLIDGEGTGHYWDTGTGRVIDALTGTGKRWSIADNDDDTVEIRDAATGELLTSLFGHDDDINCTAFGPNDLLASGSDDHTVRIWHTATEEAAKTLTIDSIAERVALSPDGGTLAYETIQGELWLWQTGLDG